VTRVANENAGYSATNPTVSILLATRNRLPYLRAALASARSQDLKRLEILVSDDGSIDGSVAYLADVSREDPRVRFLTGNPTPGVYENFLFMLGLARGEYVVFLGDDDLLEPGFVRDLLAGFSEPGVVVSYGAFDIIDGDGCPLPDATGRMRTFYGFDGTAGGVQRDARYVALRGQLWLGACLYPRRIVTELGFNTAEDGAAADWGLALSVAELGAAYYVPTIGWHYRDHGHTASRRNLLKNRQGAVDVLRRRSYVDPDLERLRTGRLRRELLLLASRQVLEDTAAARRTLASFRANGGSRLEARHLALSALAALPAGIRVVAIDFAERFRASRHGARG